MSVGEVTKEMERFRQYMKRMKAFEEAASVLYWDMRTGAPRKGIEARSEVMAMLSTEVFKMSVSDEMAGFIQRFRQDDALPQLDAVTRRSIEECAKDYDRSRRIPAALYQEYVTLTSQSEAVWEEAKHKSDFAMFEPYLSRVIGYNKQFIQLWGYEDHPYDTLLDLYEPQVTVAQLDPLFNQLRAELVPLLHSIRESAHKPDVEMLHQSFDKTAQREFCLFILGEIGYDFDAGRLDESSHPFATGLNPGDVRITTRYGTHELSGALFGTIHECGHALYDQNISADLAHTVLCNGASMGIHESQSRFWENVVARSRPFWQRYFPALQDQFPNAFANVDVESFYRAVNDVQPTLIRTEADELTYNLHVMIRYELEKKIFAGELSTKELPGIWNEMYREYLGIVPDCDRVGILQDVHWAAGLFGYFPSYSLGNMYAAQLTRAMRTELGDFTPLVLEGNFSVLKDWLIRHVHRHGKMLSPADILMRATGQTLRADELVKYLTEKYTDIYKLS